MVRSIRWAIIGLGRFGMMHALALGAIAGIEVVAAAGRDQAKIAGPAAELGISRVYGDWRQLLDDPEVEAVSITTHWQEHATVACDALAAGKHVLLEKPMAPTLAECRRILDAAAGAAGLFMVGHICRFDPRITLAREAVLSGRLGRIVSMHARRNLRKAPGSLRLDKISPLMGDGVHDADLMMWLAGDVPTRVFGRQVRVDQFRYPDIGWAMLDFGGAPGEPSAVGVVEVVWRLPESTPFTIDARLEIIGTEGAAYVDCGNAGLAINDQTGWHLPDTVYWPEQHGRVGGALVNELAYFADCIRTGRPPTVVAPEEAAQAVAVIEAAEQSASAGQPVAVPRVARPGD